MKWEKINQAKKLPELPHKGDTYIPIHFLHFSFYCLRNMGPPCPRPKKRQTKQHLLQISQALKAFKVIQLNYKLCHVTHRAGKEPLRT